ncbi:MAG: hypothetical protein HY553_21580, partial [Elusimicrobia bacterium]|nr:hypothetical protein [Elusimicrobiota bacterium]
MIAAAAILAFGLAAGLPSVALGASASEAAPREPAASIAKLREAYRKAKDPDARFWIVVELERLLKAGHDERALEALIEAAG